MRPITTISCALLVLSALTLSGCAEHRLVVQRPNPGAPPATVESAALGWGASQRRNVAECDSNIIDEVRVKQNLGQSLISVLTLGFYMPTTIEYVCGNVPSEVGTTDR
jgi:hypothetical protein